MTETRCDVDVLTGFATRCVVELGLPETDAALAANSLVQADLWGHPSHGLMRLFWYGARLQSKAINATPNIKMCTDAGALSVIDGDAGMGQVVAQQAMQSATERAQTFGIGAVAVRNSGHFGTAMYFTRQVAMQGCIGFLSTNASPAMAPWGGREKRIGTNPWSWAAPAGKFPPMMLDIANTAVARGKLHVAKAKGEAIPECWAMDADGNITTDAAAGIAGTILPMAGHKGYGMATMVDVLSGILAGGSFGKSITGPYVEEGISGAGHLVIAIDIAACRPLSDFIADMEALISELKSTPRADGVPEIFYPGEPEARSETEKRATGIPLAQATLRELKSGGEALGVAFPD